MIVVRVLSDRAVVREEVCRQLPVTLGRGPDSDVVLTDTSVSLTHARLEAMPEGGVRLVDLESVNGLHVGPQRMQQITIDHRVRCRVGRTHIEVEVVSDAPPIEVSASEWHRLNRRRGGLYHAASLLLGLSGWALFAVLRPGFWSPWQKERLVGLLSGLLVAAIVLPIVAFVLLIVLKTVGRAVRVSDTLRTVALLIWLLPLATLVGLPAYYLLTPSGFGLLGEVVGLTVTVVAVVASASIRRARPRWRFVLAWTLAVMAMSVGFSVVSALAARRSGAPAVSYHIQPPIAGWAGRSQTLDDLLADIDATAERAQADAEEVRRRQSREAEAQ